MPQNLIRLKQLNESEISGFILNTTSNAVLSGFYLDSVVNRTTNQLVSGLKTFVSGVNLNRIDSFTTSGVDIGVVSGSVTLTNNLTAPNVVYSTGLFTNNQYIDGIKIFKSGISGDNDKLSLFNSNLINYTREFIGETANFIISANDSSRFILARSSTEITGFIVSGNPTGFHTSITQIGAGQIRITGSGSLVRVNSYNNQFRTAGQFANITLLHTGSNGYIIYGNTAV